MSQLIILLGFPCTSGIIFLFLLLIFLFCLFAFFTMIFLRMDLLLFFLIGLPEASWTCRLLLFIKVGTSSAMISLNTFSAPFSPLLVPLLCVHWRTSRALTLLWGSAHFTSLWILSDLQITWSLLICFQECWLFLQPVQTYRHASRVIFLFISVTVL